jgi:hypothetical protein
MMGIYSRQMVNALNYSLSQKPQDFEEVDALNFLKLE